MNSDNLEKLLRREMGLLLLKVPYLPFLNTGTSEASFHAAGKYYWVRLK
jgi:hypothetical protein